jgi:hypothetical protein
LVQLIEAGEAVRPESLIAPAKFALIEAALSDAGNTVDAEKIRNELPPMIADHEIRLVCAAW